MTHKSILSCKEISADQPDDDARLANALQSLRPDFRRGYLLHHLPGEGENIFTILVSAGRVVTFEIPCDPAEQPFVSDETPARRYAAEIRNQARRKQFLALVSALS